MTTDPTNLTPPADAPLPWTVRDDGSILPDVLDARGIEIACIGTEDNTIVGIDRRREAHASIARYLVACANAYPGLVAERDALRADLDVAADDLTRFRMQYLTVADAIAPNSNGAHELADKVRAFRKRAEALEADRAELDRQLYAALAESNEAVAQRDTALARVAELEAELDAYANAAATEIQALRQRVADLRWKAKP